MGDQIACQSPDEGVDVAALVPDEVGVGSTLVAVFVSASGGDKPDRGASGVSCVCSTSSTCSFGDGGEGSFERTGSMGGADMEVDGMSRCLVRSSATAETDKERENRRWQLIAIAHSGQL